MQPCCSIAKTDKKVLMIDDGLQYYELQKDYSIVCQKDALFEFDTLLPQGRLREIPHTNIDAIVSNGESEPAWVKREWEGVQDYYLKREIILKSGVEVPGIMVCGVAKPNEFFYLVQKRIGFIGDEMKFAITIVIVQLISLVLKRLRRNTTSACIAPPKML